ncbi:ABC transporter substrate-binding protein [Arthrobacter sp. B6]|uniref:ABC transporter substrate-binding protein n=1 Tax=Arthrobacter sp. B6 TaxID=1570137 RepID=UPI0008327ABC|nr:ABC transporter substrate-binding protein [Arthrobacter sp. B6]
MKNNYLKAALAALLLTALSACGGGSVSGSAGTTQNQEGLQTLRVGFVPAASAGALQLGMDKGIFEKHGFKLELTQGTGGAALLPAVTSGSLDIALGHPLAVLTAQDKGLDMSIVAGYGYSPEGRADSNGVVTKDASIQSAKDLADKTVSVNTIKGPGDLTIKEAVAKDGGDPNAVKFTEMPFSDAQAQLERGNADAIWLSEPFLTNAVNSGLRIVTSPYGAALPGQSTQLVFTSSSWASSHGDVIKEFRAALKETLTYAAEHEVELRAVLPTFIKMEKATADTVVIEDLDAQVHTDKLQKFAGLMTKYGYTASDVDVAAMVAD